MASNSVIGYGTSGTVWPAIGGQVLYFLTQEQYNRYGVQSALANIYLVRTPSCCDLVCTFTSKGSNPGQSITLSPLAATYGQSPGNWCEPGGFQGVIPRGSPW